ncbi:hypothetical protein JCM14076_31110 [Methylosoma difficile]
MKIKNLFISASITTIAFSGCATTSNVLPLADGNFLSIIQADSESGAYQSAIEDAKTFCGNKKKQFVVVDRKISYQGIDKSGKAFIDAIDTLTGAGIKSAKKDDYRLEFTFRCQ